MIQTMSGFSSLKRKAAAVEGSSHWIKRCSNCRERHMKCEPEDREWPGQKCLACEKSKLPCSEPTYPERYTLKNTSAPMMRSLQSLIPVNSSPRSGIDLRMTLHWALEQVQKKDVDVAKYMIFIKALLDLPHAASGLDISSCTQVFMWAMSECVSASFPPKCQPHICQHKNPLCAEILVLATGIEGVLEGLDITSCDHALHWTMTIGNLDLAERMLQRLDPTSRELGDLLRFAVREVRCDLLEFLIKQRKSSRAMRDTAGELIHDAILLDNTATIKVLKTLLIDTSFNINYAHWDCELRVFRSPLYALLESLYLQMATGIQEDILQTADGLTPSKSCKEEILEFFLSRSELRVNTFKPVIPYSGRRTRSLEPAGLQTPLTLTARYCRRLRERRSFSGPVCNEFETVFRSLLRHGNMDINYENQGAAVLAQAMSARDVSYSFPEMELVLRHEDLNINVSGWRGRSPLMVAASLGNEPIVCQLLERKDIEVNLQDNDGWTALHLAALGRQIVLTPNTLTEDVPWYVGDGLAEHIASLHAFAMGPYEVTSGHQEILRHLLRRQDTETAVVDRFERTPMRLAADYGNWEAVEIFLTDHSETIRLQDVARDMILHAAAASGFKLLDILCKELGQPHSEPNRTNLQGRTPLMEAARSGNLPATALLLQCKRVEVNYTDSCQNTALHLAIASHSHDIANILLQNADVDVNKHNLDGFSPLHFAVQAQDEVVVCDILKAPGVHADFQCKSSSSDPGLIFRCEGKTALHLAADIAKRLHVKGAGSQEMTTSYNIIKQLISRQDIDLFIRDSAGNIAGLDVLHDTNRTFGLSQHEDHLSIMINALALAVGSNANDARLRENELKILREKQNLELGDDSPCWIGNQKGLVLRPKSIG